MRALTPLTLKDHYFTGIEAEINRLFSDIMYAPLLRILRMERREVERELKNSRDPLRDAITEGIIWYEDGQFRGRFNARTSAAIIRLGGVFNVKTRTYSLPKSKVPADLKMAQVHADSRYELMRGMMLDALDNMDPESVDLISKAHDIYYKTIENMDIDFKETLPKKDNKPVDNPFSQANIIVEPKLTADQRSVISRDWGKNLDLYIKSWTDDNILKLREQIQPHVMAGGRAEGLQKVIVENYGVSQRKAKFLARQETGLLMAKYKETKYTGMGIQKYRWSDAHDKRVRHDHHELNGKIFRYDSPPITCTKGKNAGARNNPGQDFGCRCVDIPLLE